MPYSGRVVPELENNTIRELLYKNYRIVYRVLNETDIEILAVVHGARDFDNLELK